jgi:hypothetical protein
MRLFGSLAVFELVFLARIPFIREQNDLRRAASLSVFGFGAGGFKFMPSFLADARPLAFKPPFGFLPSARCQAGDFAISHLPAAGFAGAGFRVHFAAFGVLSELVTILTGFDFALRNFILGHAPHTA